MDEAEFDRSGISQQARLPTVKDPKLWSVKVKPGMERELTVSLMNKYLANKAEGKTPLVYSVVSMDHLKGYIYVESFKEAHVRDFVMFMHGVYATKIVHVPQDQMASVISIPKTKITLKRGDWVRVKRGLYRDDLALVNEYDAANEQAWVKIVPRLDLDAWEKRMNGEDDDSRRGVKRGRRGQPKDGVRPPARLFNAEDVRQYGPEAVEAVRDQNSGTTLTVLLP